MRKEIPGYPLYFVTDEGEVVNRKTGTPLKGCVKNAGYVSIILSNKGSHKSFSLHRIVAEAFCEKRPGANEVNHKNGNKLDNRASNLEWVTRGENLAHAYETGLMPNDATPRAVIGECIETGEIRKFPSIYRAARTLRISQGNICMACKGQRPYTGGYFWKYA